MQFVAVVHANQDKHRVNHAVHVVVFERGRANVYKIVLFSRRETSSW